LTYYGRWMTTPGSEVAQRVDTAPTIGYTAADHHVDDLTRARLAESVPANTSRAYALVYREFDRWCAEYGRVALPATAETLAAYVSHLITGTPDPATGQLRPVMPATISQAVGAIRKRHKVHGFDGQPNSEAALQLLRGYRRKRAQEGLSDREALPLLQPELRQIFEVLDLETVIGKRDHVLLVLGFAMMARRSELADIKLSDLAEDGDGLAVNIRTSKTDKDSRGVTVAIPRGAHADLDAVALVRDWRALLASRNVETGPLLRTVDRYGNIRGALKPDTINAIVQRLVKRAKLPNPELYSAHSLRAGGLTAALRAGVPLGVAAKHGRWSPNSPVVIRYARTADRWRDNAMRGVL
jgi:integrase